MYLHGSTIFTHTFSYLCNSLSLLEMHSAGMTNDPDVVLLRWAFWMPGDLILIYYWGGLCSVPSSADEKQKTSVFFINLHEALGSAHDQCGSPRSVPTNG